MSSGRTRKVYSKNESPFYKLKNRRKLGGLLGLDIKDLEELIKRDDNYRVFTLDEGSEKPREVQEPKQRLKVIHQRLFRLLQRIQTPEYLHSGVQGKSYISNAETHIGAKRLLNLDIKKFFPSTKSHHVFNFFHQTMLCSRDVSGVLAKLCTVNGHVPTGSSLSQIIAFFAHYEMFQKIHSLVHRDGLKMTCYVDDITISGEKVSRMLMYRIRGILHQNGLKSHPRKEQIYFTQVPREVTGSIVTGAGLLLPNKKHLKIHTEIEELLNQPDSSSKLAQIEKLIGKAIAGSQSDHRFLTQLDRLKQEKKRIHRALSVIDPNLNATYLFTDGGSKGNPGRASIGMVIKSNQSDVIFELSESIGYATNNQAEYKALIRGLQESLNFTTGCLICFSDSQVMVRQMNGYYKVKNEGLKKLFFAAKKLASNFEAVEYRHVLRTNEGIQHADNLLNQVQ